ncbi:MBL fold metallo-hydrolase [Tianweitania sediminis]|uniref:MBL fold metallo-hydrolase n=1 Tax=Tianweitania sediminis TaxID=1502156 RepID=A0A8J7UFI0_9HYPH|nr:MBL fold metallo-hydrolase [Tianweitania sediminis]MBP0437134.1 MBL fold metallo-hydrolase [Tianweitania sediminis]
MAVQIPLDEASIAGTEGDDGLWTLTPDLAFQRHTLVNVVYLGTAANWVLIDTGIKGSAKAIRAACAQRFGEGSPPAYILMTHGHFDHVGALVELADEWDVPVYAHPLEHPYLNGTESYPSPEPWVGGGIMPLLSPLFPTSPVDVGPRLRDLPADGSVPGFPEWRWLHTPGHTRGHVSLWRESDRAVIAGDAFVTTGQESAYEVAMQTPEMHGPPRYFTPDWVAARRSVEALAALQPQLVVTGHGRAMAGAQMLAALEDLARRFDAIALPPSHRASSSD